MKLTEQNYKRLAQLSMCTEYRCLLESYAPQILLNGSVEVREENVKEAFLAAETQEQIDLLEEIFPEKKPLKKGTWYKHKRDQNFMFCYNGKRDTPQYGFDTRGQWCKELLSRRGTHQFLDNFTKATKEEVEQRLKEEAERRGYVKGVKVKSLFNDYISRITYFWHLDNNGKVWCMGDAKNPIIFENGKWAEILENSTYKRGDRFIFGDTEYILCRVDNDSSNKVNMVSLNDGNLWGTTLKVEDKNNITQQEFNTLCGGYDFVKKS